MSFAEIVFQAHSGLRYLVLLVGLVAVVYALIGWVRGAVPGRGARILGGAFVGLLDLQALLGVMLLFLRPFYGALIGHASVMVLAVIVAHLLVLRSRRRPESERGYALYFAAVAVPLMLIIGGILAIRQSVL